MGVVHHRGALLADGYVDGRNLICGVHGWDYRYDTGVIGCLGMRARHTNNCPVGTATQQKGLRARLIVDESARRLANSLEASVELMQVLARACGHTNLRDFSTTDLTTWKRDIAHLTGVRYAGVGP